MHFSMTLDFMRSDGNKDVLKQTLQRQSKGIICMTISDAVNGGNTLTSSFPVVVVDCEDRRCRASYYSI